jgi:predicted metal-dependent hydrolase
MPPVILALVNTPALRDAIARNATGFDVRWSFEAVGYQKAGEPGRQEIAGVAELNPALIVIELDRRLDWLPKVHSDPATRRIPAIVITQDEALEKWAMSTHVNAILTPEAFVTELPSLFTAYARVFNDAERLSDECEQAPPPLVLTGLHQFNAHEYFEAHETLEGAWMKESGPVRDLYRAILQVGIAYYQIERRNYWGAHKMFLRMLQWFAPLPDRCQGIDVAQLREDAAAARAHLEVLGPERIGEFDRSLLKPVVYEGAPT